MSKKSAARERRLAKKRGLRNEKARKTHNERLKNQGDKTRAESESDKARLADFLSAAIDTVSPQKIRERARVKAQIPGVKIAWEKDGAE